MDGFEDKRGVCVSELILTEDNNSESGKCEDNLQAYNPDASRDSPILGRYFKLPELLKTFDPDPPTLDSSLPYIPVYTHLKTFDLAPIERPSTPPIINKLRSGGSVQTKNRSKSRATAMLNGKSDEADDQADQAINHSGRVAKYEDSEGTLKNDGTLQDEST